MCWSGAGCLTAEECMQWEKVYMRLRPCSARDASSPGALTSHCVSCLLVSSLPPMAPPRAPHLRCMLSKRASATHSDATLHFSPCSVPRDALRLDAANVQEARPSSHA